MKKVVSVIVAAIMFISVVAPSLPTLAADTQATGIAPASVTYAPNTDLAYRADGTLTVTPGAGASGSETYVGYFANANGKIANYSAALEFTGNVGTLGSNAMVPDGADRIIVYSKNGSELSDTYATAMLPTGAGNANLGEPLYTMNVLSDVHIEESDDDGNANAYFRKALDQIKEITPNSIGLFINGDIVDDGTDAQYEKYNSILTEKGFSQDNVYEAIGNHEFYPSSDEGLTNAQSIGRFLEKTGNSSDKVYFDTWINDAHFIFLGSESGMGRDGVYANLYNEQYEWLEAALNTKKVGKENEPVYVFLHQGLQDTVAGTKTEQGWHGINRDARLRDLLKEHPEVVLFSGHSHWEMEGTDTFKAADENLPNILNTASTKNISAVKNEYREGSQGYFIYVYEDAVVFKGRDFYNNEWIGSAQFIMRKNALVEKEGVVYESRDDVSSFRGETPTVPTKEGYVFAGWYRKSQANSEGYAPLSETEANQATTAIAKFVDAKVLSAKAQVENDVKVTSEKTQLRLVTSVDSTSYKQVGFKLTRDDNKKADLSTKTVYNTIRGYLNGNQETYKPNEVFGTAAAYFATKNITEVVNSEFLRLLTVTPYWITIDGTTVEGNTRTFKIVDGVPVEVTVTMEATADTDKGSDEALVVNVSENLTTQLIINGDEANVKNITLSELTVGNYQGKVFTHEIVNDLKIGDNILTVRATKTDTEGQSHITEETYTYKNDAFLYVREDDGKLEYTTDGGETVLKYSEGAEEQWYGFGSRYISAGGLGDAGAVYGGFATNGITYVTMKVKLDGVGALDFLYGVPGEESEENEKTASITASATSPYLEKKGVESALVQGEWLTLKIPVVADRTVAESVTYRNFNVNPWNGSMLIKDVQYHTDEYIAPVTTINMTDETRNTMDNTASQGLGMIRAEASIAGPAELIINGDEANKIPLGESSYQDWAGLYMSWNNVSPWINQLKIGDNTLTIRVTKTVESGATLVAEKDFTYNYKGFTYVEEDPDILFGENDTKYPEATHSLTQTTDESGNAVLKFTESGVDASAEMLQNGLRSYYITYTNRQQGYYVTNGIKYITMDVKVTSEGGLFINYTPPNEDNVGFIWETLTYGTVSQYIDNNGLGGALQQNEWATIKIPVASNGTSWVDIWRNFYVRPRANNGEMYVRNVQYHTDEYIAPVVSLGLVDETRNNTDRTDWSYGLGQIVVSATELVPIELIINGDEANKVAMNALTEQTWSSGGRFFMSWNNVYPWVNQLRVGDNTLTLRATKTGAGGGILIAEQDFTYNYKGFTWVQNAAHTLTQATDEDGNAVLKFNETGVDPSANMLQNGLRSYYVTYDGNKQGYYANNGITYVTMEVKVTDGEGIFIAYTGDSNNDNTGCNIWKTIYFGITDDFVSGTGKLQKGEWATITIPLKTNGDTSVNDWRDFYVRPYGNNGEMYIRNVQYH